MVHGLQLSGMLTVGIKLNDFILMNCGKLAKTSYKYEENARFLAFFYLNDKSL